jgi:TolB-like protein/DNA-binding winged helix-turn-helix (wHTH) protein
MEEHAWADVVQFSGFYLDRRRGCLLRQDEAGALTPVVIGSRALDILGLLIDRDGDVVSKDEILNGVWPGVVEGANVTVQISALRRVLDEGRTGPSLIQTIPGRGYRFVAPVTLCKAEPRAQAGRDENRAADELTSVPVTSAPIVPTGVSRRRRGAALVIAAFIVMLVLAGGAWRLWLIERTAAAQRVAAAVSSPHSLAAPRLSIVVLPFANLGEDRDQQYLADAIADDVTSDLSRIVDLFVISRNTAFTYRERPLDTKQIGRELGVHYVLQGSVRRSSNQLRVDTQLIDAETDAHLWADRFDGDTGDLFTVQSEITSRIAIALNAELIGAEAARSIERPDALNYLMRGRASLWKSPTAESYVEAVGFFERALALEPASVEAQSLLAGTLAARALFRLTGSPAADLARAETLVGQALAGSPLSPIAHHAKGQLLYAQRRCDEAIPEFETVIAFNRNSAWPIALLGCCKFWTGSVEEATPLLEQAVRLSPRDPQIGYLTVRLGLLHLLLSRTDEAIIWLKKARSTAPSLPFLHLFLASAYGLRGETERAGAELVEVSRLQGPGHVSSIAELRADLHHGPPNVDALFETILFAGLRKAGMPEE